MGLRSKCLRSRSRSGQNVGLRSENGSRVKKQVTGQKLGLGVKKWYSGQKVGRGR